MDCWCVCNFILCAPSMTYLHKDPTTLAKHRANSPEMDSTTSSAAIRTYRLRRGLCGHERRRRMCSATHTTVQKDMRAPTPHATA